MLTLAGPAIYPAVDPLPLLVRGDAIVALDASYDPGHGAPRTRVLYLAGNQAFIILDTPENMALITPFLEAKWSC